MPFGLTPFGNMQREEAERFQKDGFLCPSG